MTFIHFVTDISSGILSGISSGILPGISSVISSWWKLHGYQPFPLQASHCVLLLVCDVASRSAASLPNVTWRYRLQFRLQNKHAKTCWRSPASLMSCRLQCSLKNKHTKDMLKTPWITHVMSAVAQLGNQTCQDTVGNHLNQWWNAICRWGWTISMPRHTMPPPDSYHATTWFKTEFLMYTVLLSKPIQLSYYHKTRSNWSWHDELSWKVSFSYATSTHAGCIDKTDPDRTGACACALQASAAPSLQQGSVAQAI